MRYLQKVRHLVQIVFFILSIVGLSFSKSVYFDTVIIIATILIGAIFCGWLCPFGAWQDIVGKIGKLTLKKRYYIPDNINKWTLPVRYLLLFFGAKWLIALVNGRHSFRAFYSGSFEDLTILAPFIVFTIITLLFDRPFCRWFCVKGAYYGLLSYAKPITIKRNETNCIKCQKCDRICPMGIKVSSHQDVTNPQCVDCFECVSICPKPNTLSIGMRCLSTKNYKRISFALAITICFIIYTLMK